MISSFLGELIGTAILILLGNGVVANVLLKDSKGNHGGWVVITLGWAMAVFVAVYVAAGSSGAHLNPAVTVALAIAGKFSWADVPVYVAAQLIGAMIGAMLVWMAYKKHYDATDDAGIIQATFCTAPAISNPFYNFLTEVIGTFVLIFGVLHIAAPQASLGALDALPVALLVLGIGLGLGGPTGYAINPARDLGPRIIHALLPIKGKAGSNWKYSWVPVAGPLAGGALAALIFGML
ncbi:MAG: MIP/aquaporin family protein [Saprospiraceae bacterium]|nr:MIP/aquaporin family protein [Saprospiraceae bacterium]